MEQHHVSIIEDNEQFSKDLWKLLQDEPSLVLGMRFPDAEPALTYLKKHSDYACDVMILDLGLRYSNGLDAIPELLKMRPNLHIIILSVYEDVDLIVKALTYGASSYISKREIQNIAEVIHTVVQGGAIMTPMIAKHIISFFRKKINHDVTENLTSKQLNILSKLQTGLSYREIAEELCVSIETVRAQAKNIYKKLHVRNKMEAAQILNNQK